jgi:hypothetical protein
MARHCLPCHPCEVPDASRPHPAIGSLRSLGALALYLAGARVAPGQVDMTFSNTHVGRRATNNPRRSALADLLGVCAGLSPTAGQQQLQERKLALSAARRQASLLF